MKAGLISIAALSAVVAAQPQHGAHRHRHAKKDAPVAYVTEVATVTAPTKMVWVDQYGNTISADWPGATDAPAAPASYDNSNDVAQENKAQSAPAYEAPASSSTPVASYEAPAPSSTKVEQQQSSPSSYSAPSSSSEGSGYGITYSPYNSDQSCKTADQISKDLAAIDGYSLIRMYGTDCDQAGPIIGAAKSKGMKVFAGLFNIKDVQSQVAQLKSAVDNNAGGDWSIIDTVSVGNEGVNNGQYSVSDVKAAVDATKSSLPSDYKGSVVTVDTFIAIINNPDLCSVGDYTAANCHAFFDGGVTADKSGQWVLEQAQRVSEACGNPDRKVVITEAGWPSSGSTNGKAVPSKENQAAAVKDLKSAFSSNLILFTAFNDYWKQNSAATFGVEQYWGIYGDCPSS
jgi:exo-beta-1,3-glucanase (GH17 family)